MCSNLSIAIRIGKADRNIAQDLKGTLKTRLTTPRRAITDPLEAGKLLKAIEQMPSFDYAKLGLQLLALTFLRSNEIRLADWTEIDLEAQLWSIPAVRMKMRKDHLVPLSRQTIAVLKELFSRSGDTPKLFTSKHTKSGVIHSNLFNAGLERIGYNAQICPHGFRAMASTFLHERLGYNPDIIEKQLAHNPVNKIRAIYNRAEYLEERRKMMQEYADYLDSLKNSV